MQYMTGKYNFYDLEKAIMLIGKSKFTYMK